MKHPSFFIAVIIFLFGIPTVIHAEEVLKVVRPFACPGSDGRDYSITIETVPTIVDKIACRATPGGKRHDGTPVTVTFRFKTEGYALSNTNNQDLCTFEYVQSKTQHVGIAPKDITKQEFSALSSIFQNINPFKSEAAPVALLQCNPDPNVKAVEADMRDVTPQSKGELIDAKEYTEQLAAEKRAAAVTEVAKEAQNVGEAKQALAEARAVAANAPTAELRAKAEAAVIQAQQGVARAEANFKDTVSTFSSEYGTLSSVERDAIVKVAAAGVPVAGAEAFTNAAAQTGVVVPYSSYQEVMEGILPADVPTPLPKPTTGTEIATPLPKPSTSGAGQGTVSSGVSGYGGYDFGGGTSYGADASQTRQASYQGSSSGASSGLFSSLGSMLGKLFSGSQQKQSPAQQPAPTQQQQTPPKPTCVAFTATDTSVAVGESTTLQWMVTAADMVGIVGVGMVEPIGSVRVSPSETTTYTLQAQNRYGAIVCPAVTITVAEPEVVSEDVAEGEPELSCESGTRAVILWRCPGGTVKSDGSSTEYPDFTTLGRTDGSTEIDMNDGAGTFVVRCRDAYNREIGRSSCYVRPVSATDDGDDDPEPDNTANADSGDAYTELQVSATQARNGDEVTIAWEGFNTTACVITGPDGFREEGNKGSVTGRIYQTSTFTLTCTAPGVDPNPRSATITVI